MSARPVTSSESHGKTSKTPIPFKTVGKVLAVTAVALIAILAANSILHLANHSDFLQFAADTTKDSTITHIAIAIGGVAGTIGATWLASRLFKSEPSTVDETPADPVQRHAEAFGANVVNLQGQEPKGAPLDPLMYVPPSTGPFNS